MVPDTYDRPWYAKLLRVQAKLAPNKQCPELQETIRLHRALDEALAQARRPGASQAAGHAALVQMVLCQSADVELDLPQDMPQVTGLD